MGLGGVALSEMLATDAMGLEAPDNQLLHKLCLLYTSDAADE